MSALIVDGKAVAAELRAELTEEVARMVATGDPPPSLAVVLCGDDPASAVYVRNKGRAAERAGIRFALHRPPAESSTAELVDLVRSLEADDSIDGILVQLPLPAHVDAGAVTACISPQKDADGFHPYNLGRLAEGHPAVVAPCTPLGCMELLRRSEMPIRGSRAVVIGRSAIVGPPARTHAHQRRRHGHDLPLAHPRSRRGLPRGRHPGRGDRPPRHGRRFVREARGLRHRRRDDAARRRGPSATSTANRWSPSPGGSRRCRVGSGR